MKILVLDVDGTLTDGYIHIGEHGELFKSFHIRDGLAIKELLPKLGILPVIITGRKSNIILTRAKDLHITDVYQNISDKEQLIIDITSKKGIKFSEVGYVGDDLNDLPAMRLCGFKACPSDADKDVIAACDFISHVAGGQGAVREIIEYIRDNYFDKSGEVVHDSI